VFVERHIHAYSAEGDAFHAQAESLLGGVFTGQLDRSAGPHHALPRQPVNLLEQPHYLPGRAWPTCGPGNRAVAGNSPARQGANALDDPRPLCFDPGRL
jgi:hypothetical protein